MEKDKNEYKILAIEDNPGDFLLIEDYLEEYILSPKLTNVVTFQSAKKLLEDSSAKFDAILLDLSLPDHTGEELIKETLAICDNSPIIVLTGFTDENFAKKTMAMGISDYLIKDDLTALTLYKSVTYNIERFKFSNVLRLSEKRYSDLFHLSPQPMWVYDIDTLNFLDVNEAAIKHYGYSYDELMSMNVNDIRPEEDIPNFEKALQLARTNEKLAYQGIFKHKKKNGEIIIMDVRSNTIEFNDKKAEVILANDITERSKYTKTIELQNKKLKEIAWTQSHIVRAPLSRIMGLVYLMDQGPNDQEELAQLITYIKSSADELDAVIKSISEKAQQIDIESSLL